jgi:hypothetical protein
MPCTNAPKEPTLSLFPSNPEDGGSSRYEYQTSLPTVSYPPPHNLKISRTSTQSFLHTMSPESPFQDLRQASSHNYQSVLMKTRVKVLTSKTSWAVCKYSRSIASWIARHSRRGSSNWVHSASKWVKLYLPVFG